ncbi:MULTISPECIES: S53 family peptidase [Streptomyces]|uniref:S8/S53 family peptidase n=1 Tax=Streptomyces morookaense TaxID=1970 RepID=A0A7Y7B5G7_STRMO|nr:MULTISPECIES: S53 family peptidase [Streptomyces]MCC2275327.1 S53 family peptidase [Streptomyces sp. ET3-23]NVK79388.1 S8/S53 family peptidase [Streptomyces morookaense]GHF42550.1 serine protease [Streptomyces morookaense]
MRTSRSRARAGLSLTAALPLVAGALTLGMPAAHADSGPHDRHALVGTKPQWATDQADRGTTAASNNVTARVYLAGRDAKGLADYARSVSDPKSASYGKYLTPKQAKERFGTTKAQIAEVTAWLKSSGLEVTGTNDHYVTVTGDAAAAKKAFGTELHNYVKDGKTYHAPAKTASVPAGLGNAVLTVVGLNNAPRLAHRNDTLPGPGAGFRNAGPFSTYYGSKVNTDLPSAYGGQAPYAIKGYTGKQLRAVYGAKNYTGKNVTIAITDAFASPTIAKDAAEYAKRNGDKAYRKGQLSQVLPSDWSHTAPNECDASGWYGEETLDVEAVHAVAPDAGIVYVGGKSCMDDDLIDSLHKVVDNRLADIVSNSWGDVEANESPDVAAAYDQLFQQGAVEGIGFYFSSGDDGDNTAKHGAKTVDSPANSPWVTTVGGTSLAVGKGDKYLWETGWGTHKAPLSKDGQNWDNFPGTFTGGAGGGTSTIYDQPFYQRNVVPDALSKINGTAKPMRVVPDIAAVADSTTGFLVGQTQSFSDGTVKYDEYRIGGTSLAAPVIAGVQALAQQARGGAPIGFANPGIYDRFGTSAYHDVTDHPLGQGQGIANVRVDFVNGVDAKGGTVTSLRSFGGDSSLSAGVGYDNVTGVGSPADNYVTSYIPRSRH